MRAVEVIAAKRDRQELAPEALREFVLAYARDEVPDYQMAAFLMAAYLRGLDREETAALTDAMLRSGGALDLHAISTMPSRRRRKDVTASVV